MFEIGQNVSWSTGQSNIISKGLVREDLGEFVEVICYEINSMPTRRKIQILKSKLKICEL
jgi:hypothetical protein